MLLCFVLYNSIVLIILLCLIERWQINDDHPSSVFFLKKTLFINSDSLLNI